MHSPPLVHIDTGRGVVLSPPLAPVNIRKGLVHSSPLVHVGTGRGVALSPPLTPVEYSKGAGVRISPGVCDSTGHSCSIGVLLHCSLGRLVAYELA